MAESQVEKKKAKLKADLEARERAVASGQWPEQKIPLEQRSLPGIGFSEKEEEERELRGQFAALERGASSEGQGSFGELLALMTMMARLQLHEMKQRVIPPVKYQDNPMPPPEAGEVPRWVLDAAGDPLLCDLPSKQRIGIHVRILPSLYQQVQRAQKKLKLRTVTGTLEYLLKIGLAVTEKGLPLNIDSE